MAGNRDFADFVIEQLGGLPSLHAKRMFGGFGIYDGELIFGIIADNDLYFKVDDNTRSAFTSAGSEPFYYIRGKSRRTVVGSYWRVPVHVLEDSAELIVWADRAREVARSSMKKR